MATVDLVAGTVMDIAASLMNDSAKSTYTYAAQVPYINMALQELEEAYELANIPATQVTSDVIQVDAGTTVIPFNNGPGLPSLPDDMIEPQQLWERPRDINPFIPMTKKDYLPHSLEGVLIPQFLYYTWNSQQIEFLEASQDNDIKIDYIGNLFVPVVDENTGINVINARTFLEYRTAALMAEFIERNKTSSDSLNVYAVMALDRATGIGTKGKQNIMTRRRPFRSGYKRRGFTTR
jgi:hypothetical protein